ncbi:hypothetical protein Q5P01_012029 [Channa striata]|uniref:Uncharacterized protein n=1 Tax=Channa striata TaxID=64152 RepID=A0AA88MRM0_CHASR|nr:hypothetical protein Q5P01_012029 [Channa striata]
MSDCEETDFLWESWTPHGKRKRKKGHQTGKVCSKLKDMVTMKIHESIRKKKKKKKKNSKFKEVMEGRKEKKKDRKKKKNKLPLGFDGTFIFTQGYSGASKSQCEPYTPASTDHLTQNSKKKTKKKVAFDLPPGSIRVKRPKFVPLSPKENTLPGEEAVSCSDLTVTRHIQAQPLDIDSQCTCSDDINSQDLFITQKTFRTLPSEPSSGEASDKADNTTLQSITQQEMVEPSSMVQIHYHEESSTYLQGSHLHEHPKPEFNLAKQNHRTQMALNTNLTKETTLSVKPRVANPYLDDPIVPNCSMEVANPKQMSCTSKEQSPTCPLNTDRLSLLPWMSTTSISTQTENFFTSELSSYLSFYKKSRVTVCNLKPLDLSLPQRSRKDLAKCLRIKISENEGDEEKLNEQKQSLPEEMKCKGPKDPNLPPSCSSDIKIGPKKEPAVRQLWSVTTKGKDEASPNPQSDPETRSADTTSSEDNEASCRTGKVDLTQVRAVQMRLNESFFFKTKGEGQSPRPESPLMKLVQSRDTKSRKAPEVEEDIDRDGDWQQQTVEAQTVAACAALGEILIHSCRVEQTKEGYYRYQSHHHRQREHTCRLALT